MVDEKEFEDLINRYREELYRYCLVCAEGDRSLADDAFSDLLNVIFTKWDTLDKGERFRIYLYKIAQNCILSQRKKKKKHQSRHLSMESAFAEGILTEEKYYDEYFSDDTPVEEYINKIESELNAEDLKLFRLRYMEKRTINEIAETQKIPYSTLRYRYFLLEKQIRKKIQKFFS